ncbi:MAG: lipopolysaccharide heptosyltransferase I [Chlamydiota bacterium]
MKILIVKTSALGDILQCFGVLGYFSRVFPEAEIDWVVEAEYADLLNAHRALRRVIPVATRKWRRNPLSRQTIREWRRFINQLRREKYDHIFDLQGNVKSACVAFFAAGKKKVGFSFSSAAEWPAALVYSERYKPLREGLRADHYLSLVEQQMNCKVETKRHQLSQIKLAIKCDAVNWIDAIVAPSARSVRLMICMGSRWENKRLSVTTWEAFLRLLQRELAPFFFFSWGTETEKKAAVTLQCALKDKAVVLPRLQLSVWQHLMEKMDAVIAVDSSALHLAATTTTPSFGIFGPSLASCYQPNRSDRGYFQGSCPYGEQFPQRCRKLRHCPTGACLKEVTAATLAGSFFAWWRALTRTV